ncbi:MAG TPA: class I SAM-dependent methyltransferase [Gemmatimonadales bacterium]|nr:class I SAM-dependent methyltransferase [Gemmatimonadales bacterium]
MGLYSKYALPRIIHFTCGLKPNMRQREKVVPRARGRVLEVGIGSGLNLPFYDRSKVTKIWGLDPSPEMTRMAARAARSLAIDLELIGLPAEQIPLEDHSVDTVVMTYTLCSIPDTTPALRQMARVLSPDGQLIFCEHGAAPDIGVRRWQDRLNPLWKRLGGGCNLNRPIPALIEDAGFRITSLETMYLPGWRPASFNYWGTAVPGQRAS